MIAVAFDLDDTLMSERAYAHSGLRHVGGLLEARHGVVGAGARLVAILESGVRGSVFDAYFAEVGLDRAEIPELVRAYRAHAPDVRLYDDAALLLDALRGRVFLALITDGPAVCQRAKLAALDLAPRFDLVLVTDERGPDAWKPHPWSYARVAEAAGCPPDRCVYVGDNPTKDFVTPRALGWRTARVCRADRLHEHPTPSPAHEAEVTLTGLDGLLPLLGGWFPEPGLIPPVPAGTR
jgi:putative hydrolase of the HAD superfamily